MRAHSIRWRPDSIILVGKATKVSQYMMSMDKEYTGTMKLGEETDSQDAEGELPVTKSPGAYRQRRPCGNEDLPWRPISNPADVFRQEGQRTKLYKLARREDGPASPA